MPVSDKVKVFFVVFSDETKILQHTIVYRTAKNQLRDEIRADGFALHGIFSIKDVESVRANTFIDDKISDKTLTYLKANLEEWDMSI